MWIAKPWRRYELPAPHTVYKPSMKSVGESWTSTGFHRSWVGVAELFDRSNSLTSFPWPGSLGLNGSWVTDGFTRYNQLLAPQKKKIKKNLQWKSKWIREDNNYKQLIIAYIEHTHTHNMTCAGCSCGERWRRCRRSARRRGRRGRWGGCSGRGEEPRRWPPKRSGYRSQRSRPARPGKAGAPARS